MREKVINAMIDTVCRMYGFEAKETIKFCRLCERCKNYQYIKKYFERLTKNA